MAMYRCAACGSPNVKPDSQAGGIKYNYVKGAVGTVVLGPGGAAAGITSETQSVYKCPDCGLTLTYPMDAEIKAAIDLGVVDFDSRNNLSCHGVTMPWEFVVKHFKNVESGAGDEEEKRRTEETAKHIEIDTSRNAEFIEELAQRIMAGKNAPETDVDVENEQKLWELAYGDLIRERDAALEAAKKANEEDAELEANDREAVLYLEKEETKKKRDKLVTECNALKQQLNNLGFFKFSEKNSLRNKISDVTERIAALNEKLQREYTDTQISKSASYAANAVRYKLDSVCDEIKKSYIIPDPPHAKLTWKMKMKEVENKIELIPDDEYSRKEELQTLYYCMTIAQYEDGLTCGQYLDLLDKCFGVQIIPRKIRLALLQNVDFDYFTPKCQPVVDYTMPHFAREYDTTGNTYRFYAIK